MNPRERFLTTLRGGPADRVPLFLEGFEHENLEDVAKISDPLYRRLAGRISPHNIAFRNRPSGDSRYMQIPWRFVRKVEAAEDAEGQTTVSEIQTPKGPLTSVVRREKATNTLWTVKYPVESLADLDKLASVPWEPLSAPEPFAPAPPGAAERCVLRTGVSSPFVCVAGAMPFEYFLELCATEPKLIAELTAQCRMRVLQRLAVLLADRQVEYVWMGGCEWLTPPMGSPALYETLVQEPEKPLIEACHDAGAVVHIHCHGRIRSTIELTADRGGDLFEPVEPPPDGDMTFADAKSLVGDRMTLAGNVEARILECGEVQETETAVRAAFEGPRGRMMLRNTAGPIGAVTERMFRNYSRLMDLWEELSWL